MPTISVIVPVYNVELYLDECINSILRQTFTDFELILVDDGSSDKSGMICDEFGKKDARITVIHKKNGGLSSARNAGLDIAKGDYISFIDSDDWIDNSFLEKLLDGYLKYPNVDLSFCKYRRTPEKGPSIGECSIISVEQMWNMYFENAFVVIACNKLYKADVFKTLRYPEGKIHEDEFVLHETLKSVSEAYFIEEELYYYRPNEKSIMHDNRRTSKRLINVLEALLLRIGYFISVDNQALIIRMTQLCFYYYNKIYFYLSLKEKKKTKPVIKQFKALCIVLKKMPFNDKNLKRKITVFSNSILFYNFLYRCKLIVKKRV